MEIAGSNPARVTAHLKPFEPEGAVFDAIVVLPYTRVRRRAVAGRATYRMSHFTARCVLAGLELFQQARAERFILPGEQHRPATSDLEQAFLQRRGVPTERILNLPGRDGTLQQLEPVADLQRRGRLGRVVVVCFAFHRRRVEAYLRLLGIRGEVAEVEQTHAAFLHGRDPACRVSRGVLLGLPQLRPIERAENGISRWLLTIDSPFGRLAPMTRLFKLLSGPTITDIDHGQASVGLARLEAARVLARGLRRSFSAPGRRR